MDRDGQHQPDGSWPFRGRDAALARARRALDEGAGVLVFGDAGAGRTRFARELARGAGWHQVTGSEGLATVAFGAWSNLVPEDLWPLEDGRAWQALAVHLRDGDRGPIRLLVDDAHWLDGGSAALLHHLVASGQAVAVVTHRSDAPKRQPITALWKDGYLARVDLEPLAVATVAQVVEAALGAPVEPSTIERLHSRTGGSVLLIRELVEDARRSGTLQLLHGAWIETTPTRPSARLVDLLGERIDGLAPEQRAAMDVLAVAGPIELQILIRIAPASIVQVLVERGLARTDQTGAETTVALSDPIMGDVLLERLGTARRATVLDQVVEQLGPIEEVTDDRIVRTACWHLDVGRPLPPDEALRAADAALLHTDFAAAERLARAVLDGVGPAAAIRLGEALTNQQRQAEAEEVLRPLGDELAELPEPLRYRYADARALALGRDLGRLDEAIEVLEVTIATMADDRWRWALEAHLAFRLADCGRLAAAAPLAEARLANLEHDEPSALTAFLAGCLIRTYGGRCEETLELCERMTPVAMRHLDDRPEALGWIVAAQMLATYVKGDFAASLALIEGMEQLFADEHDPTVAAGLLMSHALVLSERGELDTALRLIRQSAALHELDNRRGYQAWVFAIMSRIHSLRGELGEAQAALASAHRHRWPGGQSFERDIDVAAIWVATLSGDRAGATATLERGLALAEREGMATAALRLRHEAIRAGLPVAPHVEAFATTTVGEQSAWARAEVRHVAALAADDGAGLVAVAQTLAELGLHLEAAEAFAQGAGAHRRAGSHALAARAKQQSATHRARCPGAMTPALRFGELVVGLTERELDVTTRAAAGQANQEIATALGISVRTAETHLQRSFAKLGIHRRGELAALFGPVAPEAGSRV